MKKYFFLLLCSVLSMTSCEELSYLNGDCYAEKPLEGELTVKVSIQDSVSYVPVKIFQGKYENNKLIFKDTLTVRESTYFLPVNSFYTVSAEYTSEGKVYVVIDGGEIKVKKIENNENFSDPCWSLINVSLDLELK